MLDAETFLTELYVCVDEFCKSQGPPPPRPGPAPALAAGEVVTLALFAQWGRFPSERAFHRYACRHLRPLFPALPGRAQFNRLVRAAATAITAFALHLGQRLAADDHAFEALDGTGVPTRNAKRRGDGWLVGVTDIGHCTRVGWYEGVRLLLTVTPHGAITGWGVSPASTQERAMADTSFAARATPQPGLASAGAAVSDCYVADMGFSGQECQARWRQTVGAVVISPPQTGSKRAWAKPWKTWLAGVRQVIETVNDRLLFAFGLDRERPHALSGLLARLAGKAGLHNFCAWLNRQAGRGLLVLTEVADW